MKSIIKSKRPLLGYTNFDTDLNKKKSWYLIDATGKTLGRLACAIKNIITGKHKVSYVPNVDCGDVVIVINARRIRLSGNKKNKKMYHRYTYHIGGLKTTPCSVMLDRKPEYVIKHAVWGMMRRGPLANRQIKNLRIFADDSHDMEAQKPIILT